MKKLWFAILLSLAPAAAAQSLEFGVWAGGPGLSVGPTVNLNLPSGDWTFDAYLRAYLPDSAESSFGLGVKRAFEAGPAGRGELGARGFIGMDAHYWLEAMGTAVLGQAALELRGGYTYNRTPSHFWPLQGETIGPYLRLDGKFRLSRKLTLRSLGYFYRGGGQLEAALSWRVKSDTYTLGVGGVDRASNAYALLGYKAPYAGAVVEGQIRLGALNEFRLKYADRSYKAHLTLAYPARAQVGVAWDAWALDAEVDGGGYEFYLRYKMPLEGL